MSQGAVLLCLLVLAVFAIGVWIESRRNKKFRDAVCEIADDLTDDHDPWNYD